MTTSVELHRKATLLRKFDPEVNAFITSRESQKNSKADADDTIKALGVGYVFVSRTVQVPFPAKASLLEAGDGIGFLMDQESRVPACCGCLSMLLETRDSVMLAQMVQLLNVLGFCKSVASKQQPFAGSSADAGLSHYLD